MFQDWTYEEDDARHRRILPPAPVRHGKAVRHPNGFITPAMAKKRKVEPAGEDNGRAYAEYFEGLVNKASWQELAAWLVELALIHHRDHPPYYYYGDG
jgi:hypothetical protein